MKKRRNKTRRSTKRGWYKPAGPKINNLLDEWELSLTRIHESFDRFIQESLKEDNLTITCKPGCSHCCRYAFICTLLEGLSIGRHLLAFHADRVEPLRRQLRDYDTNQQNMSAAKWAAANIDCLFLVDNKCSVYHLRPLNCRTHYAVTEPSLCQVAGEARVVDHNVATDMRVQLAKGYIKRLIGRDEYLVSTLPGAVSAGINALLTDDYNVRGEQLEGEALDQFREDWEDSALDVIQAAEEYNKNKEGD